MPYIKVHKSSLQSNNSLFHIEVSHYESESKIKSTNHASKAKLPSRICLRPKVIARIIFCAVCYGLCLRQVANIFIKYAAYPVDVNVLLREMKVLLHRTNMGYWYLIKLL